MKVYLNSDCPCGSGKKYKDCCHKKYYGKHSAVKLKFQNSPINCCGGEDGFIVDTRGAVVFKDESRQPVLELKEGSNIMNVLAVGVSMSGKPIADIKEDDGVILYILPDWYVDWCSRCVYQSQLGYTLFPSEVEFTRQGDRYAVDFLI